MQQTDEAKALSALILETFRLNSSLSAAEDRLTVDLGLTSARLQVLRAIDDRPRSVAQIARLIGLTRQAVQRIANVLVEEGFAAYGDNPEHKRAKLLQLSDGGREALDEANRRHEDWSRRLAAGFGATPIDTALWLMRNLRERLSASERQLRDGAGGASP